MFVSSIVDATGLHIELSLAFLSRLLSEGEWRAAWGRGWEGEVRQMGACMARASAAATLEHWHRRDRTTRRTALAGWLRSDDERRSSMPASSNGSKQLRQRAIGGMIGGACTLCTRICD